MKRNHLLLVIDMQNVYREGQKWACSATDRAAANTIRAIDSGAFGQVIFTRFLASQHPAGVWRDYNLLNADVIQDEAANEMIARFLPALERYPLYTKSVYSALHIPEVLAAVQQADQVAVAGVVAECCVLSTVFSLIDEGKYVIYLTDCISGASPENEQAVTGILSDLVPLHLQPMTLDEYLQLN